VDPLTAAVELRTSPDWLAAAGTGFATEDATAAFTALDEAHSPCWVASCGYRGGTPRFMSTVHLARLVQVTHRGHGAWPFLRHCSRIVVRSGGLAQPDREPREREGAATAAAGTLTARPR
jgi:hypothetical protein